MQQAIDDGLAYVTEDRKSLGLNLLDTIKVSITSAGLRQIRRNLTVDENAEIKAANKYRKEMNIKARSIEQSVNTLSGGNQQKVVLGKWMFTEPDVLILDEPTRGIDVGAKYEIYEIINRLADSGRGVLMISSELPELPGHVRPHLHPQRRRHHRRRLPRARRPGNAHALHDAGKGRLTGRMTSGIATKESLVGAGPQGDGRQRPAVRDDHRPAAARR